MSKRIFVVDDPTVAAEVETLLRSRGLNRTSQRNGDLPSMDEIMKRGVDVIDDAVNHESDFPFFKRVSSPRSVSPSPFPWRDSSPLPTPKMARPSMNNLVHQFERIMRTPSRAPFESSCGTFNPDPHHTSRLYVNGGCGGFVAADANDLAMGRQLYTSNGCGGFEPITPSYGGCGGMMTSFAGCGGWQTTPSYGGCGGTTYLSGC